MLIYASACPVYYAAHGEAFVRSAARHGYQVKVDISDGPNDYAVPKWKAAALRFLNLPELLDTNERIVVLDIDSIVMGEIPVQDDWDMALFFRPWIPEENKKLLLAASYWTPRAKPFAEHMRAQYHKKSKWLSEQTYAYRKEYNPLPCGWGEIELEIGRGYVKGHKHTPYQLKMSKGSIIAG